MIYFKQPSHINFWVLKIEMIDTTLNCVTCANAHCATQGLSIFKGVDTRVKT
jgi:hypothetical protein